MNLGGIILSVIALGSALAVVTFRNPLLSAFALVLNLIAVAGIYALQGAHFLAASQIIVYAGAIMVLVLFVLMLLNLKVESLEKVPLARLGVCLLAGAGIVASLAPVLFAAFKDIPDYVLVERAAKAEGTVKQVGLSLYSDYVVQFELASLIILVGVVGAVMLANRRVSTLKTANNSNSGAAV